MPVSVAGKMWYKIEEKTLFSSYIPSNSDGLTKRKHIASTMHLGLLDCMNMTKDNRFA